MLRRLHPGEPEAVAWQIVPLSEVVQRPWEASTGGAGRPRLVAIDGRGGSGKMTLAERLSRAVPNSAIVHTDDIAWNQAYFDWGSILADNVLKPLRRGEAVAFRPAAWVAHDRPGSITVPAGTEVVWIEGTGIIREELAAWLDASVWIQGDLDEQNRLLAVRDGDSAQQREHVANWLLEELPFLLREKPWSRATLIVGGPAPMAHDPVTEVAIAPPISR